jgi:putative membrane protein
MKITSTAAALALAAIGLSASPAAAQSNMTSGRTVAAPLSAQDFVNKVIGGTQFELQSARVALEKSQNPSIRAFADRMIKDHTKAGDDLKKTAAAESSIQLPQDVNIPQDMSSKLDELKAISGKDFDAKFIDIMAADHREDVNLFQAYEASGTDPAIKSFARRTLPTIEHHMREIESLQKGGKAG